MVTLERNNRKQTAFTKDAKLVQLPEKRTEQTTRTRLKEVSKVSLRYLLLSELEN
jgi:hypothetical protein